MESAPPPAPPAVPPVAPLQWPPKPGSGPLAVVNPHDGPPPSSSLPFAETAGPSQPSAAVQAQRAAIAAVERVQQSMSPGPAAPSGPPPVFAQTQAATGAMPGVSQDPELVPENAPRILAGFFVSYDTQPLGRMWPIYQGKNRVGRQGAAPDLDIGIDHPTASTRHALVYASAAPGRVKIEDTGSTNGTLVNGSRLPVGVRHELRDGDRIRFGLLSAIVKII